MSGGMPVMMWMMLSMGLSWIIMLSLDAVFTYLIIDAVRKPRGERIAPAAWSTERSGVCVPYHSVLSGA